MNALPLLLAEVADKEPPFWFFYACIAVCVLFALLMLKSKLAAVLAPPLAFLSALFAVGFLASEVNDPHIRPAIARELGHGYIVSAYGAAVVATVVVAALFFRRWHPRKTNA